MFAQIDKTYDTNFKDEGTIYTVFYIYIRVSELLSVLSLLIRQQTILILVKKLNEQ